MRMRRRLRLPSHLRQAFSTSESSGAPMASRSKTTSVHEALRASEHQFQLLVQGVKDYAIFMLDPQGRITTWNSGAEHIKGYDADEIIGEHFSALLHGGGPTGRHADARAPASGDGGAA